VDTTTDGLPRLQVSIATITTESGSRQCVYGCDLYAPVTITASSEHIVCYPVSWTPEGYTARSRLFNSMVTKVTRPIRPRGTGHVDPTPTPVGGVALQTTSWSKQYRTYGQFRYGDVTPTPDVSRPHQSGPPITGHVEDNNTTVVNLTDSQGGSTNTTTRRHDLEPRPTWHHVDHSTITSYWVSAATATRSRTGVSD